jgi:hypothetical protein
MMDNNLITENKNNTNTNNTTILHEVEMLGKKELKKEKIIVPKNVRFISNWEGFELPNKPSIIDKKVPGCGFTEYCLTNNENVVLCSPRKLLLNNKYRQHLGEVFYVENKLDQDETVDKDLEKFTKGSTYIPTKHEDEVEERERVNILNSLKAEIEQYINSRVFNAKPVKLLVTYDSFKIVKEVLKGLGTLQNYRIVVDEFQSIFTDSRFKADTEIEFLAFLQGIDKVNFVSATPMIDEYLIEMDEFCNLPYYELDWETEDPTRLMKPDLKVRTCKSINDISYKIIQTYLNHDFEKFNYKDEDGKITEIESREVVFFVNSVSNILGIIKKSNLKPEQCNILVANTPDNAKKLKRRLGKDWVIGDVPIKGEEHKMFTFCTRTVYLGADFYSTNARTIILSDANVETLSVDISLDLPQILGRQRNIENPWRNHAEFYYKTNNKVYSKKEFDEYIAKKLKKTDELLDVYKTTNESNRTTLAEKYKKDTVASNYKDDYVSVNEHTGRVPVPCLNKLVLISEKRAFDIQQVDYKDRFSVFNALERENLILNNTKILVNEFLANFNHYTIFDSKLKYLCEFIEETKLDIVLDYIPLTYKNYYNSIGPERCKAFSYRKFKLDEELALQKFDVNNMIPEIHNMFKVGEIYSLADIKEKLKQIYSTNNYNKTAKATDIEFYFDISDCSRKVEGKKVKCYRILNKKRNDLFS